MSGQSSEGGTPKVGSTRLFFIIWVCLVAITAFEVFLGSERLHPALLLGLLVGLSVVNATLIIAYFMHLKFERLSLALLVIPATLFFICLFLMFFMPDSWRLLQMRVH